MIRRINRERVTRRPQMSWNRAGGIVGSRGCILKMRVIIVLLCVSAAGFAANWSGYLVDSGCWASRQNNVSNPTTTVDRDMNMDLRFCSPKAETKHFAVVLNDWRSLKLDPAGSEKASLLVRNVHKPTVVNVTVSGALTKRTIQVDSIHGQQQAQR
jgi:hypothetical protein